MGKRRVLLGGAAVLVTGIGFGGAAIARSDAERFRADLAGTNELPPTDLDATGRAKVDIDVVDGQVCFSVRFDDVGTPNRGHIHVGDATVNGGIVVPLFELVGMPADERNDALEQGRLEGCVDADPALLRQIVAHPDDYYVNLHNARFPGGAAGGQLDD